MEAKDFLTVSDVLAGRSEAPPALRLADHLRWEASHAKASEEIREART
jgi:hypothetical protein